MLHGGRAAAGRQRQAVMHVARHGIQPQAGMAWDTPEMELPSFLSTDDVPWQACHATCQSKAWYVLE